MMIYIGVCDAGHWYRTRFLWLYNRWCNKHDQCELPEDSPLRKACPKCRAPVGEPCRWLSRQSHVERIGKR